MNRFKYYFILLLAGVSLVSCNKSDDDEVAVVPLRDYKEQFKADNDSIIKYLKTNYIEYVTADFDIKISKIPAGGTQTSVWDQTLYPLATRDVYSNDVSYKVYFLTLRKGLGASPTNTDNINASYSGGLLDGSVFESQSYGSDFMLYAYASDPVIEGWSEIFPQFKTGITKMGEDGSITHEDFGAGVMFLPSGLGYFGAAKTKIPAYSPLVFSFKLFNLVRMDHDFQIVNGQAVSAPDGIPDYLEDLNGDGYLYDFRDKVKFPSPPATLVEDTDGDGFADFIDADDDGDGFTTKFETTKPVGQVGIVGGYNYGLSKNYPWEPIVDNPNTPNTDETEPRGIPRRPTGELKDPGKPESAANPKAFLLEDYTVNPRLRVHLDKTYPIR